MRSVMPSPRAMPLASCVLPAPRSPDKPMTSPLAAARPHASPSACVSSGLCEMFVAMGGQRKDAFRRADGDTFVGNDLSDARELKFRKFLFPGIEQRHGVAAGDGEQKFEILAIGQRGEQRRFGGSIRSGSEARLAAGGDARAEQFRADLGRLDDMPQIAGETVAEIDHRVDGKMCGEPAGFGEARFEIEMFAGERATEFAGDEDGVARFCAGTKNAFVT